MNLNRSGKHQQAVIKKTQGQGFGDSVLSIPVSDDDGQVTLTENVKVTKEVVAVADIPINLNAPIDPKTGQPVEIDREEISKIELAQRAAEVIAAAQSHYLVWEGPWAVCQTCPFRHSVPLDFQKYDLVDGQPVKKPIAK